MFLLKILSSLWDFRKCLMINWRKNVCYICGYCFVEWWVKPNNILRSIFWFLSLIFSVFKINFEPTFLQSIFVFTFCCVEDLLIRRVFLQSLLVGIRNLLSQIKWNVQKICFFEISFNLKAKTNIFKYFDDVFPNFVSLLLPVKIS